MLGLHRRLANNPKTITYMIEMSEIKNSVSRVIYISVAKKNNSRGSKYCWRWRKNVTPYILCLRILAFYRRDSKN